MKRMGYVACAMSIALIYLALPATAQPVNYTQGFDTVGTPGPPATGIFAAGWLAINNSNPLGDQNWNQGVPGNQIDGLGVNAQSGAPNSFIQTNFGVANGGIASDWLITPVLELENGSTISFYTQTNVPVKMTIPNELQVWESQSGSSTVNVGTTAATPGGDFTVQLLDINPGATAENGTPGGYPTTWTQYTLTISGLSAATDGRIGFRYYLPDATTQGTTIGIDSFNLTAPVPEPSQLALLGAGCLVLVLVRRSRRTGSKFKVSASAFDDCERSWC